jgi:hypothetical protein
MKPQRIRLGRNDGILKSWYAAAADKQINISHVAAAALTQYINTGSYLCIATIKEPEESEEDQFKSIYLSPELVAKIKERGKPSSFIKEVLKRSIKIGSTVDIKDPSPLLLSGLTAIPPAIVQPEPIKEQIIEPGPVIPAEPHTEAHTATGDDDDSLFSKLTPEGW